MTEQQKYIHLRLKQARRAERPYTLLKLIVGGGVFVGLLGCLQNCGNEAAQQSEQQIHQNARRDAEKANIDIWGGTTATLKHERIP